MTVFLMLLLLQPDNPIIGKATEAGVSGQFDRGTFLLLLFICIGLVTGMGGLLVWLVRTGNKLLREDLRKRDETLVAMIKENTTALTNVASSSDEARKTREQLVIVTAQLTGAVNSTAISTASALQEGVSEMKTLLLQAYKEGVEAGSRQTRKGGN